MLRSSLPLLSSRWGRPMLQSWLDENLPQLVERLVQREIEMMAGGAKKRQDEDYSQNPLLAKPVKSGRNPSIYRPLAGFY